jgi:Protein of unknown function (DUF3352)
VSPRLPAPDPRGLDAGARRRIGIVALCALAVALVVVLVLIVAGGGDGEAGAARLVPADALAYVSVDTDSGSSANEAGRRIVRALPMLSAQVLSRLGSGLAAFHEAGIGSGGPHVAWLGDQAAVAVIGGTFPPATVELLAVANAHGAESFAAKLTGDRTPARYRGADLWTGKRGTAAATGGFLLFGPGVQVKRMIDTSIGDAPALSGSSDFAAATDGLPGDGLALGYLSRNGEALLGDSFSFIDPLIAGSGLNGLGFAVTPTDTSLELTARSAFDPGDGAPPLAGLETFDPKLPQTLPAKSLVYAGAGTSGAALRESLTGLAGLGNAISTAFLALVPGKSSTGLKGLTEVLGKESAVVIQGRSGVSATGVAPPGAGLVSIGVDPDKAKAALQRKAARKLYGRVTGTTLRVAGDRRELAALTKPKGSLDTTAGFSNAMVGFSTTPTLQAYLDIRSLVPLFEAAGLAENPAYASFASEVRRLLALGLVVSSDEDSITVQARLTLATGGTPATGSD